MVVAEAPEQRADVEVPDTHLPPGSHRLCPATSGVIFLAILLVLLALHFGQ